MSQSFDSLMRGAGASPRGSGSGYDGYPGGYSDRQSSEDVPESTTTATTTTTAGDDGAAAASGGGAISRDDDFTEDNNFESNLRRRKGKIISCAKETIENGKRDKMTQAHTHSHLCSTIGKQCDICRIKFQTTKNKNFVIECRASRRRFSATVNNF